MTTRATAVTMWDFSWLLRRQGPEAEYVDVDAVLDQLADRGYDTVRIDAFPHWIAADSSGRRADTITALPQPPGFMWGNHHRVDVRPLPALLEFLTGLAARGVTAGLSTWFTPDTGHRAAQVDSPEQLGRAGPPASATPSSAPTTTPPPRRSCSPTTNSPASTPSACLCRWSGPAPRGLPSRSPTSSAGPGRR